jgi:hypothetical protein
MGKQRKHIRHSKRGKPFFAGRKKNSDENKRIQLWKNGIMLTVITKKEADKLVKEGKAKYFTDSAIEFY